MLGQVCIGSGNGSTKTLECHQMWQLVTIALIARLRWMVTKMDEYIKRKEALALVKPDAPEDEKAAVTIATAKKLVRSIIQRAPAADVAPVIHAHWAHLGGDEWCCSACGFVITTEGSWDKPIKKYCEDCGARMDEVE